MDSLAQPGAASPSTAKRLVAEQGQLPTPPSLPRDKATTAAHPNSSPTRERAHQTADAAEGSIIVERQEHRLTVRATGGPVDGVESFVAAGGDVAAVIFEGCIVDLDDLAKAHDNIEELAFFNCTVIGTLVDRKRGTYLGKHPTPFPSVKVLRIVDCSAKGDLFPWQRFSNLTVMAIRGSPDVRWEFNDHIGEDPHPSHLYLEQLELDGTDHALFTFSRAFPRLRALAMPAASLARIIKYQREDWEFDRLRAVCILSGPAVRPSDIASAVETVSEAADANYKPWAYGDSGLTPSLTTIFYDDRGSDEVPTRSFVGRRLRRHVTSLLPAAMEKGWVARGIPLWKGETANCRR